MDDLQGKVAVVTGAASGIGLAMAEAFIAEGMSVVLADVDEEALAREATRLEAGGASTLGVLCDVTDPAAIQALAEATDEHFGATHVLCNNAGVGPTGPMLATTPKEWQWTVGVNLLSVAYGVTTFAPRMVAQGEGHIVNTASQAGLMTHELLGMYSATKHGVVGLSEALYREQQDTGVGVSCLCPEFVRTNIFDVARLRPDWVEVDDAHDALVAPLTEALHATGIGPDEAAAAVVAAVREDRFWILTHAASLPVANRRYEDLNAGRNPSRRPD